MESRNSSHQSRSNNFPAVSNFHSGGGGSEFGGAGTGKGYVKDLTVTKYVDKSSPALMLGCCSGTHYPSALLTVRESWRERASRVPQNKDARSLHCERYHTKRH